MNGVGMAFKLLFTAAAGLAKDRAERLLIAMIVLVFLLDSHTGGEVEWDGYG